MKTKALIISAVVCICIFAAYFIISSHKDADEDTSLPTYQYVDQNDKSKIRVFEIDQKDKDKVTFTFSSKSGWCLNQNSELPVSDAFVESLLSQFEVVIATKKLDEPSSDLSEYGLNAPICSIRIRSSDGEKNYFFGNYLKSLDSYYMRTDINDSIFLVPSNYLAELDFDAIDVLEVPKLPSLKEIVRVEFTDNNQGVITVEAKDASSDQKALIDALSQISISHGVSYGKDAYTKFFTCSASAKITYIQDAKEKEITLNLGISESDQVIYLLAPNTQIICVIETNDPSVLTKAIEGNVQ